MDDQNKIMAYRVYLLLKLDAQDLFKRIDYYKEDYMGVFSRHRTREHFKEIFQNRYWGTSLEKLAYGSPETIVAMNSFYNEVFDLSWYLHHTEEMPKTVEDHVNASIKKIRKFYDLLMIYLDAELEIYNPEASEQDSDESAPSESEEINFIDQGEESFEFDSEKTDN